MAGVLKFPKDTKKMKIYSSAGQDGGGRALGRAGPGVMAVRGGPRRGAGGEATGGAGQEERHSGLQRRGHGPAAGAVGER